MDQTLQVGTVSLKLDAGLDAAFTLSGTQQAARLEIFLSAGKSTGIWTYITLFIAH